MSKISKLKEWTTEIVTVTPKAYCGNNRTKTPLVVFNDLPTDFDIEEDKVYWHHLTYDSIDGDKEVYLTLSIRGKIRGKELFWVTKGIDTTKDRRRTLHYQAKKFVKIIKKNQVAINVKIRTLIEADICSCENFNPERAKYRGKYIVFNTYYLPNFLTIPPERKELSNFFSKSGLLIKGTYRKKENQLAAAAEAITNLYHVPEIKLESENFVSIEERSKFILDEGDRIGVFRKRLYKNRPKPLEKVADDLNWLTPKRYLCKDIHSQQLGSKYYSAIAKNGIVEVVASIPFNGSLSRIMTLLLCFAPPTKHDNRNCQKAASAFVNHIHKKLASIESDKLIGSIKTTIRNKKRYKKDFEENLEQIKSVESISDHVVQRERQRYIIMQLEEVICDHCNHFVTPERLQRKNDKQGENGNSFKEAFLEGNLIYEYDKEKSPSLPQNIEDRDFLSKNLSTSKNEMVVFGFERGIIYPEQKTVLQPGNLVDDDSVYWDALLRALQHFLSLKTAIHLLENATIKTSEYIPKLMTAFERSKFYRSEVMAQLNEFALDMEIIAKYIPSIREVSVATSAYRASYAVEKFHYLSEKIFYLPAILQNIQANVEELSNFLQVYMEKARQEREASSTKVLGLVGLSLAIIASMIAAPALVQAIAALCGDDSFEVCVSHGDYRSYLSPYFTVLLIVQFFATILFFLHCRTRNHLGFGFVVSLCLLVATIFGYSFGGWYYPVNTKHEHLPAPVRIYPSPTQTPDPSPPPSPSPET
ncbi:MAG: hypothetical protein ACKVRN_12270 [Pyrinomonadaceae bacterium]